MRTLDPDSSGARILPNQGQWTIGGMDWPMHGLHQYVVRLVGISFCLGKGLDLASSGFRESGIEGDGAGFGPFGLHG